MAQKSSDRTAARRYAEAAFGIAREDGTLDRWREDLQSMAELVQHPDAGPFLANERVAPATKTNLVERALVDMRPEAMNLARILLHRNRLHLAPAVLEAYDRLSDEFLGVQRAIVTTAVPLTSGDVAAVEVRLREMTGAQDIRLEVRQDPALIGGMIVQIGDRLIDGSTRTRLLQLKRSLVAG